MNTLFNQLDYQVDSTSIVCQLIDENYESCLNTDSLSQIELLLKELDEKLIEQEKRVNELVSILEKLYTKLSRGGDDDDESAPKRSAAYILRHNTAETVKQLENEIADLQAKRMATSRAYCGSMRTKIEELYELCQIGGSERHLIDFGEIFETRFDNLIISF